MHAHTTSLVAHFYSLNLALAAFLCLTFRGDALFGYGPQGAYAGFLAHCSEGQCGGAPSQDAANKAGVAAALAVVALLLHTAGLCHDRTGPALWVAASIAAVVGGYHGLDALLALQQELLSWPDLTLLTCGIIHVGCSTLLALVGCVILCSFGLSS